MSATETVQRYSATFDQSQENDTCRAASCRLLPAVIFLHDTTVPRYKLRARHLQNADGTARSENLRRIANAVDQTTARWEECRLLGQWRVAAGVMAQRCATWAIARPLGSLQMGMGQRREVSTRHATHRTAEVSAPIQAEGEEPPSLKPDGGSRQRTTGLPIAVRYRPHFAARCLPPIWDEIWVFLILHNEVASNEVRQGFLRGG